MPTYNQCLSKDKNSKSPTTLTPRPREKIDNSKLLNVYKQKRLVPMFTNKDFNGWFQLCLLLNPFQNGLFIFGWLFVIILLEFHVK